MVFSVAGSPTIELLAVASSFIVDTDVSKKIRPHSSVNHRDHEITSVPKLIGTDTMYMP